MPEAQTNQGAANQSVAENARTEQTVNFEISRTNRTHVHETGLVRRLSVAVLVDGTYTTAEDGTRTYSPRSEEELPQLAALVRSTVGFDQSRGDTVEVINSHEVLDGRHLVLIELTGADGTKNDGCAGLLCLTRKQFSTRQN